MYVHRSILTHLYNLTPAAAVQTPVHCSLLATETVSLVIGPPSKPGALYQLQTSSIYDQSTVHTVNRANDASSTNSASNRDDAARSSSGSASDCSSLINVSINDYASRINDNTRGSDSLIDPRIQTACPNTKDSRFTGSDCDDVVDARNQTTCPDNTRTTNADRGDIARPVVACIEDANDDCDTCKYEKSHNTSMNVAEESASKCDDKCKGLIDVLTFSCDLIESIHDIPSEADAKLKSKLKNGWKPQYCVLSKLEHLPLLVTPTDIRRLRYQFSLVQRNEAFLLHAANCAERFDACT
ncbi:uncharacterized protein ARMOST_14560 [Armillaria ostoyae]|uniref:Phospho-2-dehydro-3-deoxyheptonate aldolase n=1 Tax=Armillaria ostoyae TaxID=47428 RepID=A0A284RQW2_ARMOS|nr:uncharacterized protein ARMOST_14560 [Armillaria ostoyae]